MKLPPHQNSRSSPVSVDAVFNVEDGLPAHRDRDGHVRDDSGESVVKALLRLERLQLLLGRLDVGGVLGTGGSQDEDELLAGTHSVVYLRRFLMEQGYVYLRCQFIENGE